ncbi:MAG: hypothetical protein DRG78_13675 [Epsilonproteobacteria bacterium]|nr:MAG: hypothetical protein DRG78_13675 [Campylobacterota bacterium]
MSEQPTNPFNTAPAPVATTEAAPAPATEVSEAAATETTTKKDRKDPVARMNPTEKDAAIKLIMAGGKTPAAIAAAVVEDATKPVTAQQVRNLVQKLRKDFTTMLESDTTTPDSKAKIQKVLEGPLAKSEGIGAGARAKSPEQKNAEMLDILASAGF